MPDLISMAHRYILVQFSEAWLFSSTKRRNIALVNYRLVKQPRRVLFRRAYICNAILLVKHVKMQL